jgi:hypothetical protein
MIVSAVALGAMLLLVRAMSVGAVSSMSIMVKLKSLLKVCPLASATLIVILRVLVVS